MKHQLHGPGNRVFASALSSLALGSLALGSLALGSLVLAMPALAQKPAGVAGPPAGHTTLLDAVQSGDVRTEPRTPIRGDWGIITGHPESGAAGAGLQITKVGQGVVYPTTGMLSGSVGTIEFSVETDAVPDPAPAQRGLLDSWSNTGPARILVTMQGTKLSLAWTDDRNQTKTIQTDAAWPVAAMHRITVLWDAADISLLVDGAAVGKIDAPVLPAREPLGIVVGNTHDFQNPALMTVSNVRLSTAREPNAPPEVQALEETLAPDEVSLKTAQAYQVGLYPMLERLRQQNVQEVPFAYAMAYNDINDISHALDTVTPMANDPNNPLYVQAIFLRADLLSAQKNYGDAIDQLQVLDANKDVATSVRAKVKEASVYFDEGDKADANKLISDIIARYQDVPEVRSAYFMIGMSRFAAGDFADAYRAFKSVDLPGAPSRQSIPIGIPLEIKVADPDQAIRISDAPLPVTITSEKSGDKETLELKPAFSRGLYLGTIVTELGEAKPGDGKLQVHGDDKITITYMDKLANKEHRIDLTLATDAKLTMIAQSSVDIYRELMAYQTKNLLDDRWIIVSNLPKTATAFFRNPDDGLLYKKGHGFDGSFLYNIRPGQSAYVEVNDPDEDLTAEPDKVPLQVTNQAGKKMTVTLIETGPHTGIFAGVIKTTPVGQPVEGALEVTNNDKLTGSYVDPLPAAGTMDPIKMVSINVRSTDGSIAASTELKDRDERDGDKTVLTRAVRVSDGQTVTITITDRDLDTTDLADKAAAVISAASGGQLNLTCTETGTHTGVFVGTFKLITDATGTADGNVLKAKPGDLITATYIDQDNSLGTPQTRTYVFKANIAEDATMSFERQVVTEAKIDKNNKTAWLPPPIITWEPATALTPGSLYRITLNDGDLLPTMTGELYTEVSLTANDGSTAKVPVMGYPDIKLLQTVFHGDFFVRLGDSNSPPRAYFSQTGAVVDIKDEDQDDTNEYTLASVPAINVQGNNHVVAEYIDPLAADGKVNVKRDRDLRIADNAKIEILNMQGNPLDDLKPGMPFIVQIDDASGDLTPKRDTVKATVVSSGGDRMDLELLESDVHSGIFTATVQTGPVGANAAVRTTAEIPSSIHLAADKTTPHTTIHPAPAEAGAPAPSEPSSPAAPSPTAPGTSPMPVTPKERVLEVPFDGKVTISYHDDNPLSGTSLVDTADLVTRPLANTTGVLLTKVFDDPKFEVETLVRLGESLYAVGAAELKNTGQKSGSNEKLQEASVLLQHVIERFPTSDYVTESLFLTGKIRREEKKNDEAEKLFNRVIDEYPDSDFVPEALYQLVVLHYDEDNIDSATESAMRLVYGYPDNPLVADAFLKIAEYYYTQKNFNNAAYIYKRVIDRFPDNPRITLIAFRRATAYYRAGTGEKPDFTALNNAIRYFLEFAATYKDDERAPDSLYWAAQACKKEGNVRKAYSLLTKLLFTYPDAEIKAYATRLRDEIKDANPNIEAEQM